MHGTNTKKNIYNDVRILTVKEGNDEISFSEWELLYTYWLPNTYENE